MKLTAIAVAIGIGLCGCTIGDAPLDKREAGSVDAAPAGPDAGDVMSSGCPLRYERISTSGKFTSTRVTTHAVLDGDFADADRVYVVRCGYEGSGAPCPDGYVCTGELAPDADCSVSRELEFIDGQWRALCSTWATFANSSGESTSGFGWDEVTIRLH